MNQRVWKIEEDNYIKDNIGNITFSEMAKYLNCSISTVQHRALFLGLNFEKKKIKRWTEEEIEILKLMAPKYLNKTIARKLGRTIGEVNKKAKALDIKLISKRPVWKKRKIKFLEENLNNMSITQIAEHLEVNYYQIMEKIDELGLTYNSNRWTPEEEQILIQLASKCYIREIAKVLNKTENAIISKAKKMGLNYITLSRKYTEEELDFIKSNWGSISVNEMARTLKVSRNMIQRQADLMNLSKLGNNPYRKWTEKEIEKLRNLAKKKTITELAKYFKTTNEAIVTVASRNDIILIDKKIHWTEEDNILLKEYAKTMNLQEIALKMNRSNNAVRLQALRQGITIPKNQKYQNSIWTNENSEQLKELALQGKTILQIAKIMHKKDQTILKKASEMGININKEEYRSWREDEIEKLIELSKTKTISELVNTFERSSAAIKMQAKKIGINIINDRKNWTDEEIEKLKKLVIIEKKSPKEIAGILERTEDSIIVKINRLGLKIQTNDKRYWTNEEETILEDLWGSEPIEKIAKKLNRTVSSVRNKAGLLKLGSQIESNYDGLKIKDICDLFKVRVEVVSIYWVSLGLKYKIRNISHTSSYRYVEINDLYEFLENNQNIWDSRNLEKNILGKEPEWLQEKRKFDKNMPIGYFGLTNLTKQQLIISKQYFLDHQLDSDEIFPGTVNENITEPKPRLVKKINK